MLLVGNESLVSFLLVHVRRQNAKKKSQNVYLFHNLNDLTASNVFGHASERIDSIDHGPYFVVPLYRSRGNWSKGVNDVINKQHYQRTVRR